MLIEYTREAQQRLRRRIRSRPARLREEAAKLTESARPLRAAFVGDVFADLCEFLELDAAAAAYDEPTDDPSNPVGFSEPA